MDDSATIRTTLKSIFEKYPQATTSADSSLKILFKRLYVIFASSNAIRKRSNINIK